MRGVKGPELCTFEGCKKKYSGRGFCIRHYKWALKRGLFPDAKRCSVDSCEQFAIGRGFCAKHYARWVRHGDAETVKVSGGNKLGPKKINFHFYENLRRAHSQRVDLQSIGINPDLMNDNQA